MRAVQLFLNIAYYHNEETDIHVLLEAFINLYLVKYIATWVVVGLPIFDLILLK